MRLNLDWKTKVLKRCLKILEAFLLFEQKTSQTAKKNNGTQRQRSLLYPTIRWYQQLWKIVKTTLRDEQHIFWRHRLVLTHLGTNCEQKDLA